MNIRHFFGFIVVAAYSATFCYASSGLDPYSILGLSPDATQDEIRSNYRKLCLKYHPDKNVGKTDRERNRCEEMFKKIQSANDLIGDATARRRYDLRSSFSTGSSPTDSQSYFRRDFPRHQFQDESVDAFYRAFAAGAANRRSARFYRTDMFGRESPLFGFSSDNLASFWNSGSSSSLKSVYIQRIKVPLQDLYSGRSHMELNLKDSVWKRYSAAFRGGFGYLILYQSLIYAAPMLRLSRLLTLVLGAVIFHKHVPKPDTLQYTADILPGYKDGTKIIFHDAEPGFDVIFLVEEAWHDRFKRVGNDLYTTVDILASQARNGCTLEIMGLDPMETPTTVKLRPNEIKKSGESVKIKGKGWPIRKTGQHGDLVVEFRIVHKLSRRKTKRRSNKKAK